MRRTIFSTSGRFTIRCSIITTCITMKFIVMYNSFLLTVMVTCLLHFSISAAAALQGRLVCRYVGYDLADTALTEAARNLAGLDCPVELHKGDLLSGLKARAEKFDVIFTSFALHHLASGEKSVFFQLACQRLNENGVLLFIDTMRDDDEDRGLYLDRYCAWLRSRCKTLSAAALDLLCAHIRSNDFPETTTVVQGMATDAGFSRPVEMNRFGWHHTWYFHRAGGSEATG